MRGLEFAKYGATSQRTGTAAAVFFVSCPWIRLCFSYLDTSTSADFVTDFLQGIFRSNPN